MGRQPSPCRCLTRSWCERCRSGATATELSETLGLLLKQRREQLSAEDVSISGWNVGLNSGKAAGVTVFHAHWHLIPPREGDCEEPRGGVRGVIAGRQGY